MLIDGGGRPDFFDLAPELTPEAAEWLVD